LTPEGGDTPTQIEFAWHVHTYTNEYVRFADTKAAAVLAISAGLIGGLFAAKAHRFIMDAHFVSHDAELRPSLLFAGALHAIDPRCNKGSLSRCHQATPPGRTAVGDREEPQVLVQVAIRVTLVTRPATLLPPHQPPAETEVSTHMGKHSFPLHRMSFSASPILQR
jgi:hypothetical protein